MKVPTQNLGASEKKTHWPRVFPVLLTCLATLLLGYMVIVTFQQLGRIIAPVFLPLLISLAVAYLLEPLVERFESYRISRSNSTIIALIITTLALGLVLFVFLPQFWTQLGEIIAELPSTAKSVAGWVRPKLDALQTKNPVVFEKVTQKFSEFTQDPTAITEPIVAFIKGSLLQVGSLTASVLNLILIPLFIYYILVDFRNLTEMLHQLVPPRNRATVSDLFTQVDAVLRNFVRGQLLVCSAMATLYVIAFFFLDVPMWFALGILSGFGHLVPYFGTASAAILVISFTSITHPEWWRIITVIATYPVIQSIEGFILTPKILGEKLELHPFMVLVGIILGHHLFGILGIVLAAPVMACAKIFMGYLHSRYLKSSYYQRVAQVSSQTIPFVGVETGQIVSEDSFAQFTEINHVFESDSVNILDNKPAMLINEDEENKDLDRENKNLDKEKIVLDKINLEENNVKTSLETAKQE
jgi:predicted PurR-regulated permease PerM